MYSSVSPKDEIWFLRVCHHISTGLNLLQIKRVLDLQNNRAEQPKCLQLQLKGTKVEIYQQDDLVHFVKFSEQAAIIFPYAYNYSVCLSKKNRFAGLYEAGTGLSYNI